MRARKHARIGPTDAWRHLQGPVRWPEQEAYEGVRQVILFRCTPADRAREAGRSASTTDRETSRLEQLGIRGFLDAASDAPDAKRLLPQPIGRTMVGSKTEYLAVRPDAAASICDVGFGRRPGPDTAKTVWVSEKPLGQRVGGG